MEGYGDLFGTDVRISSLIPANMMNANAASSNDWGALLRDGIRGAAQGAIAASVQERYADGTLRPTGQLPPPPAAVGMRPQTLLIIAVIAYMVLK